MGTIAQKLTYLNDTKQLLKENINNLGGNLTNEPFRQYASVLEGIYESLPKVSGIGASLSLSPSLMGKIKLNEIQGNTLQDGTPTPSSPVPIQSVTGLQNVEICGKNLCNEINQEVFLNTAVDKCGISTGNTGLYIKVNGGNYTISTTTTQTRYRVACSTNEPSSTQQTVYNGVNRDNTSNNITIDTTGYNYLIVNATDLTKIQIEKSSTATTYEPYKGNTYEVNLGKNLLDLDYTSQTINGVTFTINEDKSITLNGTSTSGFSLYDTQPIKLKAGTYTHSSNQIKRGIFLSLNNISATMLNGNNNVTETTFTISQDTTYPKYLIYIDNNITFDNYNLKLQLEKGSTATSYSPYFTPIELNKIGDYQDRIYKNNGKWYVEKNIGEVVLNGSESWSEDTGATNPFYIANVSSKIIAPSTSGYGTSLCNIYKNASIYAATTETGFILLSNGTTLTNCRIRETQMGDLSGFKNRLSQNNAIIYSPLATPKYEVITNTELINQLESLYNAKSEDGTTNINVTSEDLSMILNVSVIKGDA